MARLLACLLVCAVVAPGVARSQEQRAHSARVGVAGALIEAEQLVTGAIASAGRVSVQRMAPFGSDWSGGAQLVWVPPAADPRNPPSLKVTFAAPAAGTYSIVLRYTQAPDYGLAQVQIGRKQVGELNGHGPAVRLAQTTLANVPLAAGPNELVLRVVGKAPQSTGYLVGIDAIQLFPVSGTASPSATGGVQQQMPAPIVGPSAKLTFAALDAKNNWTALGALERDLYDSGLASAPFAWESAFAPSFEWRWQVATQPFPAHAALSAPGLIAQGPAHKSPFKIDFSHIPPFGKPPVGLQSTQGSPQQPQPETRRPPALDLYIRLVPLQNKAPAGPPSNTIVAHYKRGKNPVEIQAQQGFKKQAEIDAMKASMLGYSVSIVSFQPAKFPSRPGWIVVVENPYAGKPPHPLWSYQVGKEYGPKPDPHFQDNKDALYWIGQAFEGWLFAWEGAASFYGQAKTWVAGQIAKHLIPCELLGDDLETSCEAAFEIVVDSALTAAMASQGIPPTLPSLSGMQAAAEGDLLDAAVDFTCDQIQGEGGECDPLLKQQLRKAYGEGLEQLKEQGKRAGQEPDCQGADFKDAHMIPLPCFTDYPGTKVKPAAGAVYEPPLITVKVTRTKPVPAPYAPCAVRATVSGKNHFSGHSFVNGQKLPAKDIAGDLYVPATVNIPLLEKGESATLTLALPRYQPFSIASNASTPNGTLAEWAMLYWGAQGTLGLTSDGPLPKDLGGVRTACSAPATQALTLPTEP